MKTGDLDNSVVVRTLRVRSLKRGGIFAAGATLVAGATVWSAILAKQASYVPPLADVRLVSGTPAGVPSEDATPESLTYVSDLPSADELARAIRSEPESRDEVVETVDPLGLSTPAERAEKWGGLVYDREVRWFNGRPARPARTLSMKVTAYSPDERSCDASADGLTATLHDVSTNGHCLVAADPKILKYGTMLTIAGYDEGRIVPVLDCGGAIRGKRLDVLFPTHEQARAWGVRTIKVVVWEYCDGLPAENPRKLR